MSTDAPCSTIQRQPLVGSKAKADAWTVWACAVTPNGSPLVAVRHGERPSQPEGLVLVSRLVRVLGIGGLSESRKADYWLELVRVLARSSSAAALCAWPSM